MKVLFINTSDHTGGAAIAALRILKALQLQGVEATLLCRDRMFPENRKDIVHLKPSPWLKVKFFMERLEIFLRNGLSRDNLFAIDTGRMGNDVTQLREFREADVIHLHWTNQAMLSLDDLERILRSGKRVVWTLHDMWPFTGICHNADQCLRWKEGCGKCQLLRKPKADDLSATIFRKKAKIYGKGRFTAVGCSRWLANLAAQAPLFKGQDVASIPNPIDTDFYQPAAAPGQPSREAIRHELGLPEDMRLLLFTAFKVTDPNKGIDYLIESINMLIGEHPELQSKLGIVLAGKGADTLADAFPIQVFPMGYVKSEERIRQLYQAADLLLMPTLMDNLPNTIVEAMACGVPCVAFSVGGVPQMVDEGVNGYLVPIRASLEFARAILKALRTQSYDALCRNARSKAVSVYSQQRVAQQYIELYKQKT